jgi:hypothetical protein
MLSAIRGFVQAAGGSLWRDAEVHISDASQGELYPSERGVYGESALRNPPPLPSEYIFFFLRPCFAMEVALESWICEASGREYENRKGAAQAIFVAKEVRGSPLSLRDLQLTSLPGCIGSLRDLDTLNLGNNRLAEMPAWIGDLPALKVLHFDDNQLVEIPPEIGRLKALIWLDLRNNRLAELPDFLARLPSSCKIRLGGNFLSQAKMAAFRREVERVRQADPTLGPDCTYLE